MDFDLEMASHRIKMSLDADQEVAKIADSIIAELSALRSEHERLSKSIISIATNGTCAGKHRTVAEAVVASLRASAPPTVPSV